MKFFLSYSWKNNDYANFIETKFNEIDIVLTRDIHDLKPLEDMNLFMESGQAHNAGILMITPEYLVSVNCMYEACHIYSVSPEKILPIVDETIDLSSTDKVISILKYWEEKETQEEDLLKKISLEKAFTLSKKYSKLKIINLNLANLINYIQRIKYINLANLVAGDLNELEFVLNTKFKVETNKSIIIDKEIKKLDQISVINNSYNYFKELEALLAKFPNSIKLLTRKIAYKYEIGLKTEAEKELDELIIKYPENAYLTNQKGCISIEHYRDPSAAIKYFERTIEIDPTFSEGYYNLGTTYSELNQAEKSLESYKKCIQLRPNHYPAWMALGWLYWHFYKNILKASESFEIGLEFRNSETKWLLNYATFLSEALNNHIEALDIYHKILKEGFNTAILYRNICLAYLKLEKYEDALIYAKQYENEYGDDSFNANNLAEIYENLFHNEEKSAFYYKKAIELNESNEIPYRNYAILLKSQTKFEEAEKNLIKAIELNSNFKDAKNDLALLYIYNLNKVDIGLALLHELTYSSNYYELAHYNLGLAFMDLKMFRKAKIVYQDFIKKFPGDKEVFNKLVKIDKIMEELSSG
ncbi:tetratricopeptide repeat protein [Leptospira mtsangambouensis]|uniref:tetratricopeptide repeat protein n=1 Tax=Leptospira mtsangambouensis TaxID=2484912 RepID=UPI001EEAA047|nr:tetratricopeptide repeat protein [Leptospira mtsangambouensis]MCG6142676.1 tetratricopeptide repeat protein [Leptospira mtsangambouensis]